MEEKVHECSKSNNGNTRKHAHFMGNKLFVYVVILRLYLYLLVYIPVKNVFRIL